MLLFYIYFIQNYDQYTKIVYIACHYIVSLLSLTNLNG